MAGNIRQGVVHSAAETTDFSKKSVAVFFKRKRHSTTRSVKLIRPPLGSSVEVPGLIRSTPW
jgi:hypothetical protein